MTLFRKGVQAIFCDLSIPAQDRFTIYQFVTDSLVALGIPFDEIQFIHDFNTNSAREDLFKRVNAGAVRVILGSTAKLGTGVNI